MDDFDFIVTLIYAFNHVCIILSAQLN